VGVAAREERALAPDGQPQRRSRDEVAAVDVAPARVRREGAHRPRLVGRHAHGAEERFERNLDPGRDGRGLAVPEVVDLEERVREVGCEQTELR
jgi:hypothetical protein